ncbi:hypothetical protein ACNKHV_16990 [Shigella flexneri]
MDCQRKRCCIIMPTQRRVWQSISWPLDGGDAVALTLDHIGWGKTALCGAASACG